MTSITIGLDIAKSVFQVHVEDAEGRTVTQRRLRRSQVAAFLVGHAPFPPERRAVSTLTPDRDRFGLRWPRGGLQPFTCLLAESLMHGGRYAEALEQLGQLERPNRPGAIPTDRLLVALARATVAWPKSLWERQDA